VKLTDKQQRFIEEYLVDCNAKQAAIRAGYSPKSAKQTGSENLTKPDLKAEIDKKLEEKRQETGYSREKAEEQYEEIRKKAVEDSQFGPAVAAVRGKAKLYGYEITRHEHTGGSGGPIELKVVHFSKR